MSHSILSLDLLYKEIIYYKIRHIEYTDINYPECELEILKIVEFIANSNISQSLYNKSLELLEDKIKSKFASSYTFYQSQSIFNDANKFIKKHNDKDNNKFLKGIERLYTTDKYHSYLLGSFFTALYHNFYLQIDNYKSVLTFNKKQHYLDPLNCSEEELLFLLKKSLEGELFNTYKAHGITNLLENIDLVSQQGEITRMLFDISYYIPYCHEIIAKELQKDIINQVVDIVVSKPKVMKL